MPMGRRDYRDYGWSRLPGELLKHWPRDAAGDYVPPVFLKHCGGVDLEDALLVNMLEAYGVPVLRMYPGDGGFGKVILGMSGTGMDLFVPETMFETARELMEAEIESEENYD